MLIKKRLLAVLCLLVAAILASAGIGMALSSLADDPAPGVAVSVTAGELGGKSPARGKTYPVTIHAPPAAPRVVVGADANGEAITVACGTCHATRPANLRNVATSDLDEFHQGLQIAHGDNTCISCHDPGNYDRLHRADGRPVAFEDVIDLCAQCHGPQTRDYRHGSHGGAAGYWDLSRGPRVKNHCVDCHDPHSPAFPSMRPTFKPLDRFLDPESTHR